MEKELQQKYMEFQLLEQELMQMEKQIIMVQQQIMELRALTQNLEEIKNVKPGTEIFSQLGAGIFVKSKVDDTKNILLSLGADTAVIKTSDEVKETIKKQIEQMESIFNRMQEEFQKGISRAQSLQEELQKSNKE